VSLIQQRVVAAGLLIFLSWSSIHMGERAQTAGEKYIEERTPVEQRTKAPRQSVLYGLVHSGDEKVPEKAVEKPVKKKPVIHTIKSFKGWDVKHSFGMGGAGAEGKRISVIKLISPDGFEITIGSFDGLVEDGLVVERVGWKKVGPEFSFIASSPGIPIYGNNEDHGFYKLKFKVLDDGSLKIRIHAHLIGMGDEAEMKINATAVLRPN